jgi:hypothetical protein
VGEKARAVDFGDDRNNDRNSNKEVVSFKLLISCCGVVVGSLLVIGGWWCFRRDPFEGSLPSARASYVFKIIIKYFWFSFSENLMTSQRQIANKGGLKKIERELEIENKGGRERGEGQNIMSVCPKT